MHFPASSFLKMIIIPDNHASVSLFLLLVFTLHAAAASACNPSDCDSLLSLFFNISSALNWSSSVDCCLWEEVSCDDRDGRVSHLQLPSRGLSGTLSSTPPNLTRLSHLDLSHNRLFGPLPAGFFSSLTHLQFLDLSYDHLSGELPSNDAITTLDIQVLNLYSNRFHGAIPSTSFLQALLM